MILRARVLVSLVTLSPRQRVLRSFYNFPSREAKLRAMGGRLSHPDADLKDKVVIVTGGNTGIGYETSKALAFMGAHAIIACRSTEKGQQAIDQIKEEGQAAGKTDLKLECMKLDLSSLQSTKQFTEDFKQKNLPLQILICNAGIFCVPQGKTDDKLERHFQVNYLGHFLICLELLPCMLNTDGDKRIVLLGSSATSSGVWDPNNLHGDSGYSRLKFYGNSKLYMLMQMVALQRRLKDSGITVSTADPGFTRSGMQQGDIGWMKIIAKPIVAMGAGRSPGQGAMTSINAAVNPALNTQQPVYYANCKPIRILRTAANEQHQEELWRISCDLLKDYMSPEIWSKYSPSTETAATAATQDSGNNDGKNDQPTTTSDNEDKPPSAEDKPAGDKPAEDKPPEGEQKDDTADDTAKDKPAA